MFTLPALDSRAALDLATRIVAAGLLISALELLAARGQFAGRGIFSLENALLYRNARRLLGFIDAHLIAFLFVQAAAGAVLIVVGPYHVAGRIALVSGVVALLLVRWRRCLGGDGAEQMSIVVLLPVLFAVVPQPDETRIAIAIVFIALQSCLSYGAAGIAKLVSPIWRSGRALPEILATETHGHPLPCAALGAHAVFPIVACWGVILFEIGFAAVLVAPSTLQFIILGAGLSLHGMCAVFMGLNSFVWAFPATYPCLLAFHAAARALIEGGGAAAGG